jgi:phosphoesterase RecJ-like protein
MEKIRKQVINILKRSQSILIMPSAPADGDSLGSALALYLALKKLDKEVTVVSAEPVPEAFRFLPTTSVIHDEFSPNSDFIVTIDCRKAKIGTIKTKLEKDKVNIIITAKNGRFSSKEVSFDHGPNKYDVIVTVDTADVGQLGRFYEDNTELFTQIPVINIDHHASNAYFGKFNLIDIMSSATTEMLIPLIEELEHETKQKLMDDDIATLLLAGIITDTGSFQNANTTPKSFAAAAHLVKYGARQQEIIQHVFKTKRLSTLRLWGRILSNIKTDSKTRFVWATISRKDFQDTKSRFDETGGIIDELMTNAPGTEVVLLLKEREDGIISGSIRTTSQAIDASKIAQMFGGGGHVQAAGFKIESDDLAGTERLVTEKIKASQAERLGHTSSEESTTLQQMPILEQKAVDKMTDMNSQETTFTDLVIRKGKTEKETELEPGISYKFED